MPVPAQIGRYEILEELGQGAMGAVYKARDPLMDRTVAVKTVLASALAGASAAEYRERFFREARAAGRFNHPGIVTVHDVGEHEGTPFLVMEYITGRTLAAAMEAGERFGFGRIYELGREIAEALGYAHAHGVVHRDIKPANIMLAAAARGGPERAKVTDFGVAKLTAAQVTVTGQLLGTPSFMPPEQFTGATVDGRSDLFSLGVILYWMATGDKPFTGDTITAVSYKIVHTDIVPPRKINPAIPAALEQVILKLLQKDPALRYATGEALAEDLAALRAGRAPAIAEPTVVISPPPRELRSREHDPEATLDVDARGAASRAPATRRSAAGRSPAPPAAPAADAGRAAPAPQPSRWQTALLAVLAVAVLFLIWRQMTQRDPRLIVQAPAVEPSAKEAAPGMQPNATGDSTMPAPPQAASAATGAAADPGKAQSGVGKNAAVAPPAPGETPPGLPDMEKLQREIDASVKSATQAARIRQQLAEASRRQQQLSPSLRQQLLAQVLEEKPVPADQSRLIIDAARVARDLHFVIEVDSKIVYTHKPGEVTGRRAEIPFYSVLLAPGEHSVRAHVGLANRRLGSSNQVTTQFAAAGQRLLTLHATGGLRRQRPGAAADSSADRIAVRISIE